MKILLMISLLFLFTSGCSFIKIKDNLTVEEKATLLKSTARTATYFALTEYYKDNTQGLKSRAQLIKSKLSVIGPNASIDKDALAAMLLEHIPTEYAIIIQNALDVLNLYIAIDVSSAMCEDSKKLIDAFVTGVIEGCDLVLQS